jgi:CheY-like chemotaxis protein
MYLLMSPLSSRRRKLILCIDDSVEQLQLEKAIFELRGYDVLTASAGSKGLELLRRELVDLVILDYQMPEMNGAEVAVEIRKMHLSVPIIIYSGSDLFGVREPLFQVIDGFVPKDAPLAELLSAVEKIAGRTAAAA